MAYQHRNAVIFYNSNEQVSGLSPKFDSCYDQASSDEQNIMAFAKQFIEDYYVIEVICLVGQIIGSVISTIFLWKNRTKYPLKQNTNILTLLIIWSFFICNLILLAGRLIIQSKLKSQNQGKQQKKSFFDEQQCYWKYSQIRILNYFYVLFAQLMIPAIMLKMFRVSIGYYQFLFKRQWLINLMKNTWNFIFLTFGLTLVYLIFELVFNELYLAVHDQYSYERNGGMQLYQFFCGKYPAKLPGNIWLVEVIKSTLSTVVYLTQYYFSDVIDENCNFKGQYNSQLLLYILPIMSRNLLDLAGISNIMPWYHTLFVMYYFSTITIIYYHRKVKKFEQRAHPAVNNQHNHIEDYYSEPMRHFDREGFRKFYFQYLTQNSRDKVLNYIELIYKSLNSIRKTKKASSDFMDSYDKIFKLNRQLQGLSKYIRQFHAENQNILNENGFYKSKYSQFQNFLKENQRKIKQIHNFSSTRSQQAFGLQQQNGQIAQEHQFFEENKEQLRLNQTRRSNLYRLYETFIQRVKLFHLEFVKRQLYMLQTQSSFQSYIELLIRKQNAIRIFAQLNIELKY